MKRILWSLQIILGLSGLLLLSSCASDDDGIHPVPPTSDISSLPWNRPMAGESARRMGGFPQSH